MSKLETLEAWTLGAIGIARGLGQLAMREIGHKVNPWPLTYDINEYIEEIALEYGKEA